MICKLKRNKLLSGVWTKAYVYLSYKHLSKDYDVKEIHTLIKEAENIKLSPEGVMSDIHGDSDYRANLVNVMAKRAVEKLNG